MAHLDGVAAMPDDDLDTTMDVTVPSAIEERGQFAVRLWRVAKIVGPWVRSRLRRECPSLTAEDIEDALAVAVSNLWRKRNQYEDQAGIEGLFHAAAMHAAFDILKEKLRLPLAPFDGTCDADSREGKGESPASDRLNDLLQVLRSLSEEDRCIILHWANNGYSADNGCNHTWTTELASELGVSPSSLRVRRLRILKKIEKLLCERGHNVMGGRGLDDGNRTT